MKTIQHSLPSLQSNIFGELDGETGLAYFRGIPYASVEKRWTQSQTRHSLESMFDATSFAPRCTQLEGQVLVSGGIVDADPGVDEFKCLNLNVTVPQEFLKPSTNGHSRSTLPVMVWIHGGAFRFGANSVGRYRPGILSSIAKEAGHPIVLVQIGYRLGALGFAASHDLESELSSPPNANGTHGTNGTNGTNGIHAHTSKKLLGNFGLVDQQNAFEWVRDHIADFGGDPANVTAFGISAGSASVHFHMLSGKPLFDRAICMSGSGGTLGPIPFERYEKSWQELCQKTGIESGSAAQRLERLRAMNPLDLLHNYSSAAMGAMADGDLYPLDWKFEDGKNPTRCKSIILGDTRVEGIIMDELSRRISQDRFQELVKSSFTPTSVEEFNHYFNFPTVTLPYESYRDSIRRFLSIIMFQFPNLRIAETFAPAGSSYLYHFEEPSPYPGPTFGLPYHGQCALFMYNNETASYTKGARHVAREMALIWTAFAYGEQPWEPYRKSQRFMRFGPEGEISLKNMQTDDLRNYEFVDWLKEHFEEVKTFARRLMQLE